MADIEDFVPSPSSAGLHSRHHVKSKVGQARVSVSRHAPQIWPSGTPGTQTIFMKTFGCAHNQSDSEYMAGQLSDYGYKLTDDADAADLWIINTCTVKAPSQSAMETLIRRGKDASKPLVIAGCVSQASSGMDVLKGVSIVGVQQINRVVEVVEETLKGHEVRFLKRGTLPSLDLPKVRKNQYVEIIPISVGCLGACTYCKTKHARGHLGSYSLSAIIDRVKAVKAEGVTEIWLSSEDTGAYGRDIGTDLPSLLKGIADELEDGAHTMLRIGMTNPPFILDHLEAVADVLRRQHVYSFLHIPVQSGSDAVLHAMNREYTVADFKYVVDKLTHLVPGLQIATDIICGFPGETADDFQQTLDLVEHYKFCSVHISQFYPRPGTPAARMKRVPTAEVKRRSRELTRLVESFTPYAGLEGKVEKVWVSDQAADGSHLVAHTKSYMQVLLPNGEARLGSSCEARIVSGGRWSVMGQVLPDSDGGSPLEMKTTSSAERKSEGTVSLDSQADMKTVTSINRDGGKVNGHTARLLGGGDHVKFNRSGWSVYGISLVKSVLGVLRTLTFDFRAKGARDKLLLFVLLLLAVGFMSAMPLQLSSLSTHIRTAGRL